jgi:hypothetical protein
MGKEIREVSGVEKEVYVVSISPEELKGCKIADSEEIIQRGEEVTKFVDEEIESNQNSTLEAIEKIKSLYNFLNSLLDESPNWSTILPYQTNESREKLASHARLLVLNYLLKEVGKIGYKPSLNVDFLKEFVGHRPEFTFAISDGKNSEFFVSIDNENVYLMPLGKKQHGSFSYPYSKLSSLSQIISSFD